MDKKGFGGKVFDRSRAIIVSVPFKRYSLYYITGNNCKYVVANNYYTKYVSRMQDDIKILQSRASNFLYVITI